MRSHKIAAIPGDGIGPEVIAAGLEVLEVCAERDGGFKLEVTNFDWGSDYYKKHGVMMPPGGHEQLRGFDALYFGAVGAPDVPDHITLWGLRLAICQPLDQYANVRPDADPARHHQPVAQRDRQGAGLGDRARELGGRVCRPGRPLASRPAARGRHRAGRSSPVPASPGSCATPSRWRSHGRASC